MPEIYKLPNGMKAIRCHVPSSHIVHCALMIKCGGRDEPAGKSGIAHFIEHTFFKGTRKRSSRQIINYLEEKGGELNAYTTKEETCIHASVMKKELPKASDIISDILLNATFPSDELEKEKQVVIDEIHAYEDTPYEQIYDDFEGILFHQHPMGNPILGKEEHIRSFTRKDIVSFMKSKYCPENMLWIVSGDVTEKEVKDTAQLFAGFKQDGKLQRKKPLTPKLKFAVKKKAVSQYHFIMGSKAYAFSDKHRFAMALLNNILGGPGMNSRLNLNIREKYGYTYTIESGYHAFSDTGIFHIYFATDKKYFEKTQLLVFRELQKLVEEEMTPRSLKKYKDQFCGQLLMAQENKLNVMLGMGRSALLTGSIPELEAILAGINAITVEEIKWVAEKMLNPDKMSRLIYEPQ